MFGTSTGPRAGDAGAAVFQLDEPASNGTDPAALDVDGLDREIASLCAHINAATCRWLGLVGEFDRRRGQERWGFALCSQWLSWRCSISPRAAREHVRVARRLRELPQVARSFARGELSYSKVRVLSRMEDPEREAELVEIARHATAAQLERMVRAYRRAVSVERNEDAHRRRHLSWFWDRDGSLCLTARLPSEEGALFLRALEAGRDELRERKRQRDEDEAERGPAEPPAQEPPVLLGHPPTNADALGLIAETMLASGPAERQAPERYQLTVHVEAEALAAASDAPGCELERGPALPAETARRLGCDASLVAIAEHDGKALGVGRRTRAVSSGLRRALRARDRGCQFPGCANSRFVDAHHIRHWAHGGSTELENLVLLCRQHHRLVHEGGFRLERVRNGSLLFRRPDGRSIPAVPKPVAGDGGYLEAENRRLGIAIDSETGMALSAGDRMDLGLAVDALLKLAPP